MVYRHDFIFIGNDRCGHVSNGDDGMKDDTISRAAAIDALNGCTEIYLNNLPPTIYKTDAVEAVTALPPAQPGWIPCSERLPKLNGYYLTTIKWGEDFYEVDVYEYDSYYKEWNEGEYFGGTVVAWQPLPKPYREGGQDNA